MKAAAACALCLVASTQAFVPSAPLAVRSSSAVTMSAAPESRRAVLQTVFTAAAAAAVAMPAFADGSVSEATVQRSKGIYGGRVVDLASAVKAGDFSAVAAEKNAFTLLSSGGFAMSSKADKLAAKALTKQIFAAVDSKDAAALQASYAKLVELAKIPPATAGGGDTQGYSSDYDWKRSTPKGTIYVR